MYALCMSGTESWVRRYSMHTSMAAGSIYSFIVSTPVIPDVQMRNPVRVQCTVELSCSYEYFSSRPTVPGACVALDSSAQVQYYVHMDDPYCPYSIYSTQYTIYSIYIHIAIRLWPCYCNILAIYAHGYSYHISYYSTPSPSTPETTWHDRWQMTLQMTHQIKPSLTAHCSLMMRVGPSFIPVQ